MKKPARKPPARSSFQRAPAARFSPPQNCELETRARLRARLACSSFLCRRCSITAFTSALCATQLAESANTDASVGATRIRNRANLRYANRRRAIGSALSGTQLAAFGSVYDQVCVLRFWFCPRQRNGTPSGGAVERSQPWASTLRKAAPAAADRAVVAVLRVVALTATTRIEKISGFS